MQKRILATIMEIETTTVITSPSEVDRATHSNHHEQKIITTNENLFFGVAPSHITEQLSCIITHTDKTEPRTYSKVTLSQPWDY